MGELRAACRGSEPSSHIRTTWWACSRADAGRHLRSLIHRSGVGPKGLPFQHIPSDDGDDVWPGTTLGEPLVYWGREIQNIILISVGAARRARRKGLFLQEHRGGGTLCPASMGERGGGGCCRELGAEAAPCAGRSAAAQHCCHQGWW